MAELGVAIMAYGTPASPADLEEYYTHIRRGSAPTADQLADLKRRYDAIGGTSPLAERTEAQRASLEAALEQRAPGRCCVALGQKHAAPFIEDAAASLVADGAQVIVGLVLAPHYSRFSVGQYQERLALAAGELGVRSAAIDSWHLVPAYLQFLAAAVSEELVSLPARTRVLFTAHSLPERALVDDPYPDQLRASANAVAEALGLDPLGDWSLCWQSAGRTPEPWRGPDVLEVIRDLATNRRADGVLVCPQGFVSDHLEVLYDLDIEARRAAEVGGLTFSRANVVNDDPTVIGALADRVLEAAR